MKILLDENIDVRFRNYFLLVSSFGNSREKAISNLQEALDLYFEDMPAENAIQIENVEIVSTVIPLYITLCT